MYSFSILIIFHNASKKSIELDILKSLLNLDYPKRKLEFIFLNNNSKDNTLQILKKFKKNNSKLNLKIINSKTNLSLGGARNILMDDAKNDIVLFTDDDVEIPPDWIKKINKRFKTMDIDLLGGIMKSKQKGFIPTFENIKKSIKYDFIKKKKSVRLETVNLSLKRKYTKKLRFNEKIKRAEDYEFCKKAEKTGLKIFLDTENFVYHKFDTKILSYLKRHFWYGYGLFYVDKEYKVYPKTTKLTILYHISLPLIFFLAILNLKFILLFLPLFFEKYVFHCTKRCLLSKKWDLLLYIIPLETMRFYSWCVGYIYGGLVNEKV